MGKKKLLRRRVVEETWIDEGDLGGCTIEHVPSGQKVGLESDLEDSEVEGGEDLEGSSDDDDFEDADEE